MSATGSQLLIFTSVLAVALCGVFVFTAWTLNTSHHRESQHLWTEVTRLRQIVENSNQLGKDTASANRIYRRSAAINSATDLLVDALNELIEKKLYSILECNDNKTDCSFKPGPKGEKGSTGEQGKDGTNGQPGVKGQRGKPGYRGFKGEAGPPGPAGVRGLKGDPGSVGAQGASGPVGRQGLPGATGPRGVAGQRGERGYPGHPGVKGDAGFKGDTGIRGPVGAAGERGRIGATGSPGHPGYKGEKGQKGEAGVEQPGSPEQDPATEPPTELMETTTTMEPTTPTHGCPGDGWRQVVFLNMNDPNQTCPSGLQLTDFSIRTCGRATSWYHSCDSFTLNVTGQYSEVCGRAKAFQWGYTAAFFGYNEVSHNFDDQYLDGLSITRGSPKQHIWSFTAGRYTASSESVWYNRHRCPCVGGSSSPPFVGEDYFCDSVATADNHNNRSFFPDNALWDGVDSAASCYDQPGVPWFTKQLANSTSDHIDIRLCHTSSPYFSRINLQELELYIR